MNNRIRKFCSGKKINFYHALNNSKKINEYRVKQNVYWRCNKWVFILLSIFRYERLLCRRIIPWVAAQSVRWPGVPKVARSHLSQCSKSCDFQPALNCAIRGAQGVLPCVGWGCDQSIGSTVSGAIVRSWLWSTATRSSPLGYFSKLLQVVDNWTHILW